MRKELILNLVAISLILVSFYLPQPTANYLYYTGLFALSGSITNRLAIYMIFNRVPYLYGSGVIEINFEKFKNAIKEMIMREFFTKERVKASLDVDINLSKVLDRVDYSILFDSLKEAVRESKFGQLLNMFGGESALEPLREQFNSKVKSGIKRIVESKEFKEKLKDANEEIYSEVIKKIETIIDKRLQELTPKMVKELVESLIKEHLEWLVIWGGIFGGLIGFISTILMVR